MDGLALRQVVNFCCQHTALACESIGSFVPLPLAGEGQGGGTRKDSRRITPSPTLPRKRERERTEFAALSVKRPHQSASLSPDARRT
jgi:hypothetical protein